MSSKTIDARIKRAAFQKVKDLAFQYNGTIFGGFVRDEIISDQNSDQYYKIDHEHVNFTQHMAKYWDSKYMPETKARLLIPKDIDISFSNVKNSERFISALRNVPQFEAVVPRIIDNSTYESSFISSIMEVTILMRVDVIPFVSDGRTILIKADVVIPRAPNMQPPFKKLDMLCNAFIMTRDGGKRLSNCTGTIIDSYTDYEKIVLAAQIISDMMDFRTALVFSQGAQDVHDRVMNTLNWKAMKRIEKMQKRKFSWTFLNTPFMLVNKKEISHDAPKECCICLEEFEADDKVTYTVDLKENVAIPSAHMHYKCCMKYLSKQKNETTIDSTKKFVFRCPFKNNIDFSNCKNTIHLVYSNTFKFNR